MSELKAVTPEHFAGRSWKNPGHFRVAAASHLIPVVAAELGRLVPSLPLAFVPEGAGWQLVALTSLQPGSNLFIGPDGRWNGAYVPAAVRAYPFKLVRPQDAEQSVLCVHEDSDWIVAAGQGNPFFDDAGQPAAVTRDMLNFLVQVENSRLVTQRAVDAIAAAGLIVPWKIELKSDTGIRMVEGLFRVDEAAIQTLDATALAALRDAGGLTLAYAQIFAAGRLDQLPAAAALQARQLASQAPAPTALDGLGMGFSGDTIKFN
ncbi:SapC family protein [uncultured Xylophilus sp.]|uniref:SapC family protein n=1 Tax=uncultured Xylophilus sp. TaxID=296832 RepID=UPI0025D86832|nr:SapC family protein [uncultured Xylophilus sp.]